MQINLALRTIAAFEAAVFQDQGNKFRGNQKRVLPHIGDAYRDDEDGLRGHMGASQIGRECGRELWYNFRWVHRVTFEGRMLRLFNRGHLEEGRMIALLLTIGCQIFQQDSNGKQFRISEYGGHFGGSGDGVVIGIPDLQPGQAALSEYKTHNDKSFIKLAGKSWAAYVRGQLDSSLPQVPFDGEGVRSAKFEHWVQMQVYMLKMGLAVAVYFAVNKNDDHIYAEIVHLDSNAANEFVSRAGKIIPIHAPPAKINNSIGWSACKFCDYLGVCKKGDPVARNCRTCEFAVPDMQTGKWMCENKDRQMELLFPATNPDNEDFSLTKQRQMSGCPRYVKNKNL